MVVVTIPKNGINLEDYMIVFGPENGERICKRYLGDLSNRQVAEVLGYSLKGNGSEVVVRDLLRKGRCRASRIKRMCSIRKIDPLKLKRYERGIEKFKGRSSFETVDKETKEAVWIAVCDEYDNKS